MQDMLGKCLKKLNRVRIRKSRLFAVLLVLSLVVSLEVFWVLRKTGLTMAGDASCGITDHSHSDTCYTQVCICDLPEEVHVHSDACYTIHSTPAQEIWQLVCTRTEDPHVHTDSCYTLELADAQPFPQLVCAETDEAHTHEEGCYQLITPDPVEKLVLSCDLQFDPHEHTESCYTLEVIEAYEEQVMTCGLSETAHIHEDSCYIQEFHCGLQEHVHSIECYSDETADAETLLDWQNMFAGYPFTGNLRQDLVGIAKTQVGYSESTKNFEVGSDGIRRGYTRYGAWYGTPYRDWSAAFVSFCLNYAGADPEKNPGNIGANTMAERWQDLGRFAPAGEYVPSPGDLVFFDNNTAGIVSEVQNSTFYVIRGDVEGAVCTEALLLNDDSITGWGITLLPEEEPLPDFSEEIPQEDASLTNAEAALMMQTKTVTNLKDLETSEIIEITYELLDGEGNSLLKDENGNFIAQPGVVYTLALIINSPDGFAPGTYQYQIPNGLMINSGTDTLIIDGVEVGSFEVTSNGLLTIYFNDQMTNRSEVTVSVETDIQFPAQDGLIDFDGEIKVTVTPPPEQEDPTKLIKSGKQGNENDTQKPDPTKIYWTLEITGNRDSQIPGSIVTDKVDEHTWYGDHRYTDSDKAAGLQFGASSPDGQWHYWTVSQDDPMLVWEDNSWSYKIPETVICQHCGQLELGNEDWTYYINYTTTPDTISNAGSLAYANNATVDNQSSDGWVRFSHGDALGDIYKTGTFVADAAGGSFRWEIEAIIPAIHERSIADFWYITDYMFLFGSDGQQINVVNNDAIHSTVVATYDSTTFQVPEVHDATATDRFAWYVSWSPTENGIEYGRNIDLLCRCNCTAETCPWWNATQPEGKQCGSRPWLERPDGSWYQEPHFCQCWTLEKDTKFIFTYETTDLSLIEDYGGVENQLRNRAELYYKPQGNKDLPISSGNAEANITIPGLFKKDIIPAKENSIAHYKITVNEAKLSLTNGTPLHIHDEMTETLAYISGSLVITAEDANGNITMLHLDEDYTVTYDGTGDHTDENGKPVHVLDIEILHPQPVKYILDYDTAVLVPPGTTQGIKYTNSATVTLWGQDISVDTDEKTHVNINVSSKTYRVDLSKTSALTGEDLAGATFGLFNEQGGQITTKATNEQGQLFFETDTINGIILREHQLYYMQELQAPPGYQLDDTLHWFCFCNNPDDTCDTCTTVMDGKNATRIPYGQIRVIYLTNEIMQYDLPATGGPGIYPLILVSVMFVIIPLVYGSVQRRKQGRRGVR